VDAPFGAGPAILAVARYSAAAGSCRKSVLRKSIVRSFYQEWVVV